MISLPRATLFMFSLFLALPPMQALAEGTAYLRLINATGGKPVNGIVGDLTYKQVRDFSAYQPVDAGEYDASVDKSKTSVELAANTHYSLVYCRHGKKKRLLLLEDTASIDPSKAQLRLYNFSDAPARLRATNFNTDLTKDTPPITNLAAEADPLTLDVAVTLDNVDVATFGGVETQHGRGYSFLLTGALPKYAASRTEDKEKEKKE